MTDIFQGADPLRSTLRRRFAPALMLSAMMAFLPAAAGPAPFIRHLEVENVTTPLGMDVALPHFSWQMKTDLKLHGQKQQAYRLQVRDASGSAVWDSGRVGSSDALNIAYAGQALKAGTRYTWTVTVWDQAGQAHNASSWFETGMMDPTLKGWDGAEWIGGTGRDLVLRANYFGFFDIHYTQQIKAGSTQAAFILSANDPRLMDRNKNLFGVAAKKNESYFKVALDVSKVDGSKDGYAVLNFYRAGYTAKDDAATPVQSLKIKTSVINVANKNAPHTFRIYDETGALTVQVDGIGDFYVPQSLKAIANHGFDAWHPDTPKGAPVVLNPLGSGQDVRTYGMLAQIGFAVPAGQKADFSHLVVKNVHQPYNTIFSEEVGAGYHGIYAKAVADDESGLSIRNGAYEVKGGDKGAFVVADPSRNGMPMLRTTFDAGSQVKSARLYVTARGIYQMYLNGEKVGDMALTPGFTQYNKTQLYQTYDVTKLVHSGKNAMGAMLGEGWWSGLVSFGDMWNYFGDRQSLLAKLVITYADGHTRTVVTNNKDWKFSDHGPVEYASLDMGEIYDARIARKMADWSRADFDDSAWKTASVVPIKGTTNTQHLERIFPGKERLSYENMKLVGQPGNSVHTYKVLSAKSVKKVRPGVFVYNMGQNASGVPEITLHNAKAGQKITLRYAEMLFPDLPASGPNVGMLMTENYRAALSQDIYITRAGDQTFSPSFTSHGYQYIEITGIDKALPLADVKTLARSSIRKLASSYETSNPKVNQLWSNLTWSNIDNFVSIPTDCPQRNERMGWAGDISVFSPTASYLSDADAFLRAYMQDTRDDVWHEKGFEGRFADVAPLGGGFGGILWGSAGITVPWQVYQQYRDTKLLQDHYEAMKGYMAYIHTKVLDNGYIDDAALGDWLGPQNNQIGQQFLAVAYQVYDLGIMRDVAKILNNPEDVAFYTRAYNARKAFFNRTFVSKDKKTLGLLGGGPFGMDKPGAKGQSLQLSDTATTYAVGLAMNVFSKENIPYMEKNLHAAVSRPNRDDSGKVRPAYSLMTGFIGTSWISKALSDAGLVSDAYKLLTTETYPSWLYPVDQGATSIWERLNGYTVENGFGGNNGMNSFNHYSFGAVGRWMMAYSLGIQRGEPGFHHFILQPEPDPTGKITWAKGHYDSEYGEIKSNWKVTNGQLSYHAVVPANTTATLYLPAKSKASVHAVSGASGAQFLRFRNGKAVYSLGSGAYQFTAAE